LLKELTEKVVISLFVGAGQPQVYSVFTILVGVLTVVTYSLPHTKKKHVHTTLVQFGAM